MNVLSLFDGMSCGQIALDRLGIHVDNYFASEVDKHAIKVTKYNYPFTIHIGDVTKVHYLDGELYTQNGIFNTGGDIDLLIGGSPCQGFSFAGKQLNFEDPRSKLFFEFVRLLKECKPKYFFLENVKMKKEYQDVITEHLGVEPVLINSALVCAQNRKRLYWTNIPEVTQPKDKGVLLKHILEPVVDEKFYLSDKMLNYFSTRAANFNGGKVNIRQVEGKATTLTASMASCDISDKFIKINTDLKISTNQDKAECLTVGGNSGGLHSDMTLIVASRGRNPENPKSREAGLHTEQHLEARLDGKTNCLTSVQKDNLVMLNKRQKANHKNENEKANTFLSTSWKGSQANGMTLVGNTRIRRLTPVECERLQTVPDNYTKAVSNSQRYRMLGNGWTVDVIAHIFNNLPYL